jgi:hypothetical protein
MVNATIDNTPIALILGADETYSPSSGSIQKVNVAVNKGAVLRINGKPVADGQTEISLIVTDTETLENRDLQGIFISGFEVN